MKLSYIVPVYNVEVYLDECIQSLYDQAIELSDFEVIIVNDGSTDDSFRIIEKYRALYRNIVLIEQANQGLSVARNQGIRQAQGDYILFVDSDDFLVRNVISNLLQKAIELDLDVLRGEYRHCDDNGNLLPLDDVKSQRFRYAYEIINGEFLFQHVYCKEFYIPLLFIRRSLLKENKLFFREHVYFEDIEFAFELSLLAKRVMYVPVVFYIYRLRGGSITRNINPKKLLDLFAVIKRLKAGSDMNIYPEMTNVVIKENVTHLSVYLLIKLSAFTTDDRKNLLKQMDMKSISYLTVTGNIKEIIVSFLFNRVGIALLGLLRPLTTWKNKWLK